MMQNMADRKVIIVKKSQIHQLSQAWLMHKFLIYISISKSSRKFSIGVMSIRDSQMGRQPGRAEGGPLDPPGRAGPGQAGST